MAQANDEISITLRRGDILALGDDGKTFFYNPQAEEALIKLLELQQLVNNTIELAKMAIAQDGVAMGAGFTGVRGDRIKTMFRSYGGKYTIDQAHIAEIPEEMLSKSVRYSPNTKAIDAFIKDNNSLPYGINVAERSKQVSLKLADAPEPDNE